MKKSRFYRPDIDGLRALAIIPVILFHAGIAGFSGGFVGVDIFFVISGFLISSIILRELKEGKFSLIKFWERRVRRIMPVMFFISSVVVIAAYFIVLFPVDFVDFGQSLVAQSFFLANVFFMRKDSYFAGPSESMPLLHMWTLSVEEQFYVVLPLLLVAVWYFGRKFFSKAVIAALLVVALLSFSYNIYLVLGDPGGIFSVPFIGYIWGSANNLRAGFFFLPARAWEFLIGALLAAFSFSVKQKWMAEMFSGIGLLFIVYAIATFDSTTAFPGMAVLLPVFGSALIILANTKQDTVVGSLLSFPVLVWVGLISYSLYLWHWPVIVFSKILFADSAQNLMYLILPLVFMLSWFTYRFVETPFRLKKVCAKTSHMFLFGFVAIIMLAGAGLAIHFSKGMPGRASEAANAIAIAAADFNPRTYECYRKNLREILSEKDPCILGNQSKENVDFVLWGDSHSDASMPIVDLMAKENGYKGVYFGDSGCRPVLWNESSPEAKEERCEIVKNQALDYIELNKNINKVLLISAWNGSPKTNNVVNSVEGDSLKEGIDESESDFYQSLKFTVEAISSEGRVVYLMKKVPSYQFDSRKEFIKATLTGKALKSFNIPYREYKSENLVQNKVIDRLAKEGLVKVIDPAEAFCNEKVCSMVIDGKILYKDGGHLNTTGSMLLRPYLKDFFH